MLGIQQVYHALSIDYRHAEKTVWTSRKSICEVVLLQKYVTDLNFYLCQVNKFDFSCLFDLRGELEKFAWPHRRFRSHRLAQRHLTKISDGV